MAPISIFVFFARCLLQQAHSLRQGEHVVSAAAQINQLQLPLPVKVKHCRAICLSSAPYFLNLFLSLLVADSFVASWSGRRIMQGESNFPTESVRHYL